MQLKMIFSRANHTWSNVSLGIGIAVMTLLSAGQADVLARTNIGPGVELRILPLGDSITQGYQSTDGNGYRLDLLDLLNGSTALFVGTQTSGSMANNQEAGFDGYTISQIANVANASLAQRPNVVLLHAGTNDMRENTTELYDTAPERLGSLIDQIHTACPDAAVLVAQIINSNDSFVESNILTYDAAIPAIVAQRANAGEHVMVVDMLSITTQYLADDLHPDDQGYAMMANLWYQGLQTAMSNDWIGNSVATVSPASGAVLIVQPTTTTTIQSSTIPPASATSVSATSASPTSASVTSASTTTASVTSASATSASATSASATSASATSASATSASATSASATSVSAPISSKQASGTSSTSIPVSATTSSLTSKPSVSVSSKAGSETTSTSESVSATPSSATGNSSGAAVSTNGVTLTLLSAIVTIGLLQAMK